MSSSSTRSSMASATLKHTFEDAVADDDGNDDNSEDNDDDDDGDDGDDLDTVDPGGEGERLEQRGGGEGLHLGEGKILI